MRFSFIPFLLLAIPLLEISVFILVGSRIGVFATLALIFLTAVIGSILLRVQGFAVLSRIRAEIDQNRLPGRELGNGAMILVAGILLLTPGFVTDTIGFALFIPALRDRLWRFLVKNLQFVPVGPMANQSGEPSTGGSRRRPVNDEVIDLEADEFSRKPDPNTPWRQIDGQN
jgi:UPF0716 protein FxsA